LKYSIIKIPIIIICKSSIHVGCIIWSRRIL